MAKIDAANAVDFPEFETAQIVTDCFSPSDIQLLLVARKYQETRDMSKKSQTQAMPALPPAKNTQPASVQEQAEAHQV